MYKDEIKNYTTEEQFQAHFKMLDEMEVYYKTIMEHYHPTFVELLHEKNSLNFYYRKWQKEQKEGHEHGNETKLNRTA